METLFLERTPIPERGVAVVTLWQAIPSAETEEWHALREYMEGLGADPFSIKRIKVYAGHVVEAGVFRLDRDKQGNPVLRGLVDGRAGDDADRLSARHAAVVAGLRAGSVDPLDTRELARWLHARVRDGEPTAHMPSSTNIKCYFESGSSPD